jgi:hypothetical protein
MVASCIVVKFIWRSLGALHVALVVHAERLNSLLESAWPNAEKVQEEMYKNGGFLDGSWGRPEMV